MRWFVRSAICAICAWCLGACNPSAAPAGPAVDSPPNSRVDVPPAELQTGYAGHFGCQGFSGDERALCVAVSDGDFAEARRLAAAGADLRVRSDEPMTRGMTILHLAVWHRWDIEAVEALIELGVDVGAKDRRGNTALIDAAKSQPRIRLAVVRLLLESGADVRAHGERGMTALMHATMHDDTATLKALLDAGASVGAKDSAGWTALMHATRCKRGYPRVVSMLIAAGSDVNATHRHGGTALASAAYQGHAEAVNRLIEAGADVNTHDEAGWTPLLCASTSGHAEIVRRLILAGADVFARDRLGRTPLSAARASGHADVVTLLEAARARLARKPAR